MSTKRLSIFSNPKCRVPIGDGKRIPRDQAVARLKRKSKL